MAGMRWIQTHFGLGHLPPQSPLICAPGTQVGARVERKAEEPPTRTWAHMIQADTASGVVALMAQIILHLTVTCLCFRHAPGMGR